MVGPICRTAVRPRFTSMESSIGQWMYTLMRNARKNGESVWHAFRLRPGKHAVRVAVLGEPYTGSSGSEIGIQDLVVFR